GRWFIVIFIHFIIILFLFGNLLRIIRIMSQSFHGHDLSVNVILLIRRIKIFILIIVLFIFTIIFFLVLVIFQITEIWILLIRKHQSAMRASRSFNLPINIL